VINRSDSERQWARTSWTRAEARFWQHLLSSPSALESWICFGV